MEQNAKWRMAEQFGATCTLTLDDSVTHVVATAMGTDKVEAGRVRALQTLRTVTSLQQTFCRWRLQVLCVCGRGMQKACQALTRFHSVFGLVKKFSCCRLKPTPCSRLN